MNIDTQKNILSIWYDNKLLPQMLTISYVYTKVTAFITNILNPSGPHYIH